MATLTMEQFKKKITNWSKGMDKTVEKALGKASNKVRSEAVKNHLSGPKMPRGKGSLTDATLQPHTGDLRSSINTKVSVHTGKMKATVGSAISYAKKHEKGISVPKRPFLKPSLEEKRKEIDDIILDGMMEAYKKS